MSIAGYIAIAGVILSSYALYVEYRHEQESGLDVEPFVALCDIEQIGASCSAVFALPEGKLLSYFHIVPHGHIFDVPNAALGVLYYLLTAIYEFILVKWKIPFPFEIIQIASVFAMASSVYLAIILTKLRELCILCWTTHVLNAILIITFFARTKSKTKTD